MNRYDALERELTAWLVDTAMPRTPDYTTDIVRLTGTMRQRPRWTFAERWLPMSVIPFARRSTRSVPWRPVVLLAALVLLFAAVAAYVGSQPRVPAPFGIAVNGLVAYAKAGDIVTVDPTTGSRRPISSGDDVDERPLWSLDGTRLAFLRVVRPWVDGGGRPAIHVLVVADRSGEVISTTIPIEGIDPDSVTWSPDGRSLVLSAGSNHTPMALYRVEASDGGLTPLEVGYTDLDVYWRPGHEGQLLFHGVTRDGVGLVIANVADPSDADLVVKAEGDVVRPNGWTPDGRRMVYTRIGSSGDVEPVTVQVHVLDLSTGRDVVIDAGFAHVSNDGTRLVALAPSDRPCVASIDGGPCIAIGDASHAYEGTAADSARWAPDDRWIVVRPRDDTYLLDPTGGTADQPSWVADGAESWQRLAR